MPAIKRSKRLILWVVTLALFLESLDVTIITTAIPQIALSLKVNPLDLKAALTSYLLSLAVFIPISSWAAEKYGTKKVFFTAMCVFCLGSICCGLAINLTTLVLARTLQGVGGALMAPVARMVLVRVFSKKELLKVTSYVTIPALIGPMLGPVVGGFITTFLSWRWIFFVNVPFVAYGLYFAYRFFIDIRARKAAKLDKLGFLLFATASVSFTFGFEMLGEHYIPFKIILFALIMGIISLIAYWLHAYQRTVALFDLSLFQIHTFKLAFLGNCWSRLGIGGISFILPLLFQLGLGYSPLHSGFLLVPLAIGLLLMKFRVKKIMGKFGFKKVLLFNTLGLALIILALSLIDSTIPEIVIILLIFVLGLISSLQYSAMNTLVLAEVPTRKTNQASMMLSTLQQLGSSFGVGISAVCLGFFINQQASLNLNILAAYHKTFIILSGITFCTAIIFSRLAANAGGAVSGHNSIELKN
jgi:EmrB/QacA subfamily drug resistance transporter